METYKFKFNKKSIIINVDPTLVINNQSGWTSIVLQSYKCIMNSDLYSDNDKKRIGQLPIHQHFKMLKKVEPKSCESCGQKNGHRSLCPEFIINSDSYTYRSCQNEEYYESH